MYAYYASQVSRYKEFYPKNHPPGALETTIVMLRMIYKNKLYKEENPELPESFREYLKNLMVEFI